MTRSAARAPEVFLHVEASSHEPHQINWCEFVNRADGISEIEGKAARAAASEQGRERVSNSCLKSVSEKISIQMITFVVLSRLIPMKANYETKKERNNNESTDSV